LIEGPSVLLSNLRPFCKAYGPKCTANGESLNQSRAGLGTSFIVKTVDYLGNARLNGGDKTTVVASSTIDESQEEFIVKDNKDGTYSVFYNLMLNGVHDVSIIVNEEPISGSPFRLIVDL